MSWIARRMLPVLLLGAALAASAAGDSRPTAPDIDAQTQALARANAAVVGVRTVAVEDARSIDTLGRERQGSGVVIDADGLVVTIGYLILEADHVDLVLERDRVVPARVVAYDLASGFGLLQALAPLRLPPAGLGNPAALSTDEPLMIASGGADGDLSIARMVSRRAFSGYWEYHIDGALFTTPPRTDHSGAALFNAHGELMGIGSLVVLDALGPGHPRMAGNMFVPTDLLKRILPDLRERGATRTSTRAWLGLNSVELEGDVRVVRITRDSPAEAAGMQPGDKIVKIDGMPVKSLEGFYKRLWRDAPPEREVELVITRGGDERTVKLQAQDRMKTLRRAKGI
ncbi:S1C family serine protease [Piscinibacter sp. XHJ-5]|uniref:S1C family serine protease n=1 Tax=Piscinibacter sp. XHJ-5 TaxID=3037797 RepID=UPI002452B5C5|nr:S1C family serine protease [Piscinibacter sp. XHJ-5]